MAAKVDNAVELSGEQVRRNKRKERRAKYLATLTPKQRKVRDDYVAWLRWWKYEYGKLSKTIHSSKRFVRSDGHNNLETLKLTMRGLEKQRLRARTMLYARAAAKVIFVATMGPRS